ncbi:MAG: macro domain-containing protein [Promethearchaeota archaeon]
MNQLTINNSVIEIFVGDLSNTEYDAIVIPTNSRLLPSGELRCKILRKAGTTVQVECNKIINKIIKISVGSAVITSGGNLTNYLIHTHGPKLGQGNEAKKLMLSTWNSLKLADDSGLTSLALPPISKDMLGFTAKICAEVMLPTIKKYIIEKNKNLKNVSICLETLPDYKEFEKILDTVSD